MEIDSNAVRSNKLNGFLIYGTGHQLANNVSGGTGTYAGGGQDNGQCEFLVAANNFNAGGNTADNNTIAGAMNSAFPITCQ